MNLEVFKGKAENGINRASVSPREQGNEELDFDSCTFGNGVETSAPSFSGRLVRHFLRDACTLLILAWKLYQKCVAWFCPYGGEASDTRLRI